LGPLGDTRAVEPLIRALSEDDDLDVRWRAAEARWRAADALGTLGDARAVEPLLRTLREDGSVEVRKHAAKALGTLGDARPGFAGLCGGGVGIPGGR
jgi:HEAT repeat protein